MPKNLDRSPLLEDKHILIVDDDSDVLRILALNLQLEEAKVVTRRDFVSGLAALVSQRPFDALIVDYYLNAEIDGREVTGVDMIGYLGELGPLFSVQLVILLTAAAEEIPQIEIQLSEQREDFRQRREVPPRTMVAVKPADIGDLVEAISAICAVVSQPSSE